MSGQYRDRAVVLGGSITGLLVARVLADAYEHVTVVERDALPVDIAQRRGAPHGQHVHGLLPRGRQIMDELMPGLTEQLVAAGALSGDIVGNCRWILNGRRLRQPQTGLLALSASRPLIEGAIRARVRACPNVTVLDGYDIVGLRPSADRRRIVGVRVTSLHGDGSRVLPADLVVDASGRGSRAPRWLTELGLTPPSQDRVGVDLAYSSRIFEAPPQLFGDDIVVVVARFPGQKRSAVMQRLEGGRVLLTLAGILGERPPADLPAYLRYASTLPAPDAYDVARLSRPVGDAVQFRLPGYVRHRYEQAVELPAGFLVAGDAACNFNPVYGQGMSVAALNAMALRDELRHDGEPDPARYFAAVARTLAAPWTLSVGADLAIEGVTGPSLPPSPLTSDYLHRLQLAAAKDDTVAAAFVRVTSLIDPPQTLVAPQLVALVDRITPVASPAPAAAPAPAGAPVPQPV